MSFRSLTLLPALFVVSALALTGCSMDFVHAPADKGTASVGAIRGVAHGGQQPISGAHVYVMQVTTTGYGMASKSLITLGAGTDAIGSYVLTGADGSFGLTGDYHCAPLAEVYLLVEQGNPGLAPGANNPAIGLMAGLGACPSSQTLALTVPYVSVNEVSTVVTAYALAGFATDAIHISSSNTKLAVTDVTNAGSAVANLMNVATGRAYSTTSAAGSNGIIPVAEINTLADILASCINTSGPGQGGCPTLFANATADGTSTGTQPTETATAAINIAHNPAQAPGALCGLQAAAAPFQPTLACSSATPPNDFTLQVAYTGGGLTYGQSMAVDGSGNIWLTNGKAGSTGNVSLFSPLGVPLSGAGGFTAGGVYDPSSIAIDRYGNGWVGDGGGNYRLSALRPDGSAYMPNGVNVGGGAYDLRNLAFDSAGYLWADEQNSNGVGYKVDTSGNLIVENFTSFGYGSIAIDAANYVWDISSSSNGGGAVQIYSDATGEKYMNGNNFGEDYCSPNCLFLALGSGPNPIAWTGTIGTAISALSRSDLLNGTANPTSYTGGGLSTSAGIVMDGASSPWTANSAIYAANTSLYGTAVGVSHFSSAGVPLSPSTGYTNAYGVPQTIAVDGSGNVWTPVLAGNGTLYLLEMVGAATPVETPLVQAVYDNNIAGRP